MSTPAQLAEALLEPVLAAPSRGRRKLVALAGAPASGKTTLAAVLAERLTQSGCPAAVIPMDGFHLDNSVLRFLGLLDKKGAPETFDAGGVLRLVQALPDAETVYYPTFDRGEDFARAGAGVVDSSCSCVVVEGNYLLFDAPIWRELQNYWDVSIRLDVPLEVLQHRLQQRWLDHGLPPAEAEARAKGNDLVNAARIAEHSLPASITL